MFTELSTYEVVMHARTEHWSARILASFFENMTMRQASEILDSPSVEMCNQDGIAWYKEIRS